jgi:hypothetical protein
MKRRRVFLLFALLGILFVVGFSWWSRPQPIDLAIYAPADSLLYLESNRPLAVVEAISNTDAWRLLHQEMGLPTISRRSQWSASFIRWTGIGPIESVLLARSQVAVVVTDLGTVEEENTLRVRPEAALLVETHTSQRRTRAPVEHALQGIAETAYGNPSFRRIRVDGLEFNEWRSADGSRQIVASFSGSLIIIGNTTRAVQKCLDVARGRQSNLKADAQIHWARAQVGADTALTFGYVASDKSARLLSVGVPLVMGRAPGDTQFQELVSRGASKIFASLAWSSRPFERGIEDRYLISLHPNVIGQLKPNLAFRNARSPQPVLPRNLPSVTYYRFTNPAAAWEGLKTAISSQVDALTAVVFSSVLKSALLPYGIVEPEEFLQAVTGDVTTLRLDQAGENSMLIARLKDPSFFREVLVRRMGFRQRERMGSADIFEKPDGGIAAGLNGDWLIIGPRSDVREYSRDLNSNTTQANEEQLRRMTLFSLGSSVAPIVTYTTDSERVRGFTTAILAITQSGNRDFARIDIKLADMPYAATETTLSDHGIERLTRSPLGQFSTLLPLLVPERQNAINSLQPWQ